MKHRPVRGTRFFFATTPSPCPYLPGKLERRLVAEMSGRDTKEFHETLSQAGFRRSHRFAYVPICRDCSACATVRIVVDDFVFNRTRRRIWHRNAIVIGVERPARSTYEQFALFTAYQHARHAGGEMARMDFFDYQALLEDTPVDTGIVEFRDGDDVLVGCCIIDRLSDGFSAVYSFFDPTQASLSLGTFMILWLIKRARLLGLPHVYLGFWVAGSPRMAYKAAFQPLEAHTPDGWRRLEPNSAEAKQYFRAEP